MDVLSFSTSVTVAVERGTRVYPCVWDDERARRAASEHGAVLAVGRLEALRDGVVVAPSLSPAGLLTVDPVERLVLPSPNGSAIAAEAACRGSAVAVGCLRNARAVARWLAGQVDAGRSVALIAAGERWPDGSLRPALEDELGAGAIASDLRRLTPGASFSPEARAAASLFDATSETVAELVHDCAGGRELAARGFAEDGTVAADLDASSVVPVLDEGAFVELGAEAQ